MLAARRGMARRGNAVRSAAAGREDKRSVAQNQESEEDLNDHHRIPTNPKSAG